MSNIIAVNSKEILTPPPGKPGGFEVTEAVEVCPYCGEDNIFPNWNIAEKGFIATCHNCGEQIMLCDECLHAEDNSNHFCDWRAVIESDQQVGGRCFRGTTTIKS